MKGISIKNKTLAAAVSALLALSLLGGCAAGPGVSGSTGTAGSVSQSSGTSTGSTATATAVSALGGSDITVKYDSDDENTDWDDGSSVRITLNGSGAESDGNGVSVDGGVVTITKAGTYVVSGTLSDGQLRVDTEDKGTVRIVLNGADITCADSAPIYVANAKKVVLLLADGTQNVVTDAAAYVYESEEEDEPDAAVFSKGDLTINGGGSLIVNANYLDGIVSKDELKILGGDITVNAADDGIRGKDFVAVRDGRLVIASQGDGIKSTNDEDGTLGFVLIEGGTLVITAGNDGIQAQTSLRITGGDLTVTTGGGSGNAVTQTGSGGGFGGMGGGGSATVEEDTASMKGLKAEAEILIEGGNMVLDTADDSVHSNSSIVIAGGSLSISSGDDGVHSDAKLTIDGGSIDIAKSYEGIESAIIIINDGELHITASDDGVNVAGGNDGSSMNGRPGQNSFSGSGDYYLEINGGYLSVDASGDGIDVNGTATMNGGTVLVSGPTNSGNGALDYDGSFTVNGGLLVAAGSAGMAQAPGGTSSQNSALITFQSELEANTLVRVESGDGEEVITFAPQKRFQSLVVSSPELSDGESYSVLYGGSSDGTAADGLYSGGSYSGGLEFATFTVSSALTSVGSFGGSGTGGFGGGGGRGQR